MGGEVDESDIDGSHKELVTCILIVCSAYKMHNASHIIFVNLILAMQEATNGDHNGFIAPLLS